MRIVPRLDVQRVCSCIGGHAQVGFPLPPPGCILEQPAAQGEWGRVHLQRTRPSAGSMPGWVVEQPTAQEEWGRVHLGRTRLSADSLRYPLTCDLSCPGLGSPPAAHTTVSRHDNLQQPLCCHQGQLVQCRSAAPARCAWLHQGDARAGWHAAAATAMPADVHGQGSEALKAHTCMLSCMQQATAGQGLRACPV